MWRKRIIAIIILILGLVGAYFVLQSEPRIAKTGIPTPAFFSKLPFKLGLDLSGGSHLVYRADVSKLPKSDVDEALTTLRDIIERRVNLFGVGEPVILIEKASFTSGGENRLIVDLPSVTDVTKAVEMIGQTPILEFKIERPEGKEKEELVKNLEEAQKAVAEGRPVPLILDDPYFVSTELTGRYLDKATLNFDQTTFQPIVSLKFNKEGTKLFADMTKANTGKMIAIYLDGAPISTPVVREEIPSGEAQITGNFTPDEAKQLVGRLNSGALPVPIELISTQTVGATLGASAVDNGIKAALIGLLVIAIFFLIWYRLPGIVAILALSIYIIIMLALFKLVPVTLTAAGIAGFIISIGIAVDGNVLIFERLKEEMRSGKSVAEAAKLGFDRAWFSIRDSNISSLITAIILFWFGTSLIKGFALVFGLGVLTSMLSAIVISRIFLYSVTFGNSKVLKFLFGSGL